MIKINQADRESIRTVTSSRTPDKWYTLETGLLKIAEIEGREVKTEIMAIMLKARCGFNLWGVSNNPKIPTTSKTAAKPIKRGKSIKNSFEK